MKSEHIVVIKNKELYETKMEASSIFWTLRDELFQPDIYMFEVLPNKKAKLIDLIESGLTFISIAKGLKEMHMWCEIPKKAEV